MSRRGFTLVELLVGLVILGIVTGALYSLLISTQRVSQGQAERVGVQANVRHAAWVVPSELRELAVSYDPQVAAVTSDIHYMGATFIQYAATRSVGFFCGVTSSQILVYDDAALPLVRYRDPAAGRDSLLVFYEGPSDRRTDDDAWVRLRINSVGGGTCPDGRPAIALGVVADGANTIHSGVTPAGDFEPGGPVRTFETMRIELNQVDGQYWLSARSVLTGESLQPILGPLQSDGLELVYRDAADAVTADPNRVRSIDLTIRGISAAATHPGIGGAVARIEDTLVTRVRLRNAPRL